MAINTTYRLLFQINNEFNLITLMNKIDKNFDFTIYMLQYIYLYSLTVHTITLHIIT
jgi:hypothetical protein